MDKITEKEEIIKKHQKTKEELVKNMEKIEVIMETIFDEDELNEFAKKYNSESDYIDMIDNITEALNEKIRLLKREKLITNKNIIENEEKVSLNEIEIIKVLNQIKLYLDYLRKNSLNKDYSKTMESYIKQSIEETTDLEKKQYYENLRKIYNQLIEIENIDFLELTTEKYQEIKNKIMN